MSPALLWIPAAAFGACVGSFLNVCIYRLPLRQSVVRPRSFCPACRAPVAWYDNIPVLSYAVLGGRCRRCRAPISPRYPLVEAATAVLFVLLLRARGPTPTFALQAALGAALIALILIDARHQILPDAITLPGIALGLLAGGFAARLGSLGSPWPVSLRQACAGAVVGYAVPWVINLAYRAWQALRAVPPAEREDGIGRGDFKLLAMIGAFLGMPLLFFVLFVGAVTGAAFGLLMMRFGGYGWKSKLPYGVFLGGAALLALFVGEPWITWYLGVARIAP